MASHAIEGSGSGSIALSVVHPNGRRFAVQSVNITFTGGSGSASLAMYAESLNAGPSDRYWFTVTGAGVGGSNVNFRNTPDEIAMGFMVHDADEAFKLTWTDPGTSTWEYSIVVQDA